MEKNTENTARSYALFIGAMLVFGTIGIFRRMIPISSALLAFARGVMGALFLCAFVKLKDGKIAHGIGRKKVLLLALSGALMGLNWIFLFEAYNHTTVAIATLCYYMQPTIMIVLSPLLFGEKLTGRKKLCAVISLIGMVLVSGVLEGNESGKTDFTGVALGMAAACLYAAVVIFNKKLPVEDDYERTIIQLASAALVLIPYLLFTEDFSAIHLEGKALWMLLIVGIVHTGIAYACYFTSMKALSAQSIAVLSYIDPVSALILSAVFLGETMTVLGIIGAVLIIGSAIVSEMKKE